MDLEQISPVCIYGTVPYTVRKIIPVKKNMEVKCMNLHRVHETPNYKKVIAKVSVRWIRNRVPIRYPHYEKIIANSHGKSTTLQ